MAAKPPERRPESGWGEHLHLLFRPGSVRVVNHARDGHSTLSFIESGDWSRLLASLRPGDVVMLQFGHNDQSVNVPSRYAPLPNYVANLRRFVRGVRARGADPILLTPVAFRVFGSDGRVMSLHGAYPHAVRALASRERVPLIDMERISVELLQGVGEEKSRGLYLWLAPGEHPNYPSGLRDDTHFSTLGARRLAEAFAAELRASSLPLAERLR